MNFTSKARSVAANPAMLRAYARWIGAKLLKSEAPRIRLPGGASIGEWLSFSEYWGFQDIVSAPERLFIERCLAGKTGTAFDIGANVGAFTCLFASLGCAVHGFEPIPETFCRLKKNLQFNALLGHAHLNCLAVGKELGLVTFQVQEHSPATNRMAKPTEKPPGGAVNTQTVAAVSLDTYCAAQGVETVDFLKVDVEGMEPYVLQGASQLFSRRRIAAVLIEICPVNLCAVGLSTAALYQEFEAARYSPYALKDDGRPGAKLALRDLEAMSLANVALLPDP